MNRHKAVLYSTLSLVLLMSTNFQQLRDVLLQWISEYAVRAYRPTDWPAGSNRDSRWDKHRRRAEPSERTGRRTHRHDADTDSTCLKTACRSHTSCSQTLRYRSLIPSKSYFIRKG